MELVCEVGLDDSLQTLLWDFARRANRLCVFELNRVVAQDVK